MNHLIWRSEPFNLGSEPFKFGDPIPLNSRLVAESADLKYACTRVALLNLYEFDTDLSRYTLKYKEGRTWYLATPIPGTDVWQILASTLNLLLN